MVILSALRVPKFLSSTPLSMSQRLRTLTAGLSLIFQDTLTGSPAFCSRQTIFFVDSAFDQVRQARWSRALRSGRGRLRRTKPRQNGRWCRKVYA